jgi:hypothetical protein
MIAKQQKQTVAVPIHTNMSRGNTAGGRHCYPRFQCRNAGVSNAARSASLMQGGPWSFARIRQAPEHDPIPVPEHAQKPVEEAGMA